MTPWKKMCCPVDFSAVSAHAVEEAASLASRTGAAITLLHVREPFPRPALDDGLARAEALEQAATEDERQLEAWRERLERTAGTRVRLAIAAGDPGTEILRFARDGRYDVIVMGTHGRTGREKIAFGSVAQKIVLDAECPVLVVHRPASPP